MSVYASNYRAAGCRYPVPTPRVVPCGIDEVVVRDTGSERPAVVLIHGWGVDSLINYGTVLAPLGERVRAVSIDLPGHGSSSAREPFSFERGADVVWQVCDAVGIERCALVGYSMGGPISQLAAAAAPDRVVGLVQVATGARLSEPGDFPAALRNVSRFASRAARLIPWRGVLMNGVENGEYRRVVELAVGAHVAALTEAFASALAYDGRALVGELAVPAVSVITTKDRVVSPKLQSELSDLLGARSITVESGHDLCRKTLFASVLHDALNELSLTEY